MDITFKLKNVLEDKKYVLEFCLKSSEKVSSDRTIERVLEKNSSKKPSSKKDDEPQLEEPQLEEPKMPKKEFKIQSSFEGKIEPIK